MSSKDISWIKNELIPDLVNSGKLITPQNNSTGIIKSLSVNKLTSAESFMITNCYKISVILLDSLNEATTTTQHKLVVKITPEIQPELFKIVQFDRLFKNEIVAYNEVFPLLGWSNFYPKLYYSHVKENEAAIVLSDFGVDGWKMAKSLVNLSLEHILVAVRELGKFHGDAYALKEKDPEKFEQIMSNFEESRFSQDSLEGDWDIVTRTGVKRSINAVKESGNNVVPTDFLNALLEVVSNPYKILKQSAQPLEPFAILCHGDYLRNNIAFKYATDDKNDEIPVQAMMFDFQTLRYSSPMLDLVVLLSNSAGVDVRRPHFSEIFTEYYNNLVSSFCKSANRKSVPEFLSYDALLKEYTKLTIYGLIIAGSFISELHCPSDVSYFHRNLSPEEIEREAYTKGGEAVNKELVGLVEDIYLLHTEHKIDLNSYKA